ncbi:MAG: excinuclease ABC subunit UvrC [Bacteroidia bacterium]|nr:MAG: excinuclease ABC subunit UvrC [Bacteroidia bacterium]
MNNNLDFSSLTNSLPGQPGVYQFYDQKGSIIYVGKAKNLKKRVSSYFNRKKFDSYKVKVLVGKVADVKCIVVESESDALLLENTLIKKHQPRYNILLKDDKTFPWICIKNEPFPRVFSTRTVINDGSKYFGPFTSAYAVKVLLTLVRQLYQLRTCKHALTKQNIQSGKFKVCLEYHIGNCKAPCIGLQNEDNYELSIAQIREIIKGNLNEVISYLKKEMEAKAAAFLFEEALQFKEKIEILSRYQSKSTIVNSSIHDVEVYSIVSDEKEAFVNFLKVVKGAVIQAHTVEIKKKLDEDDRDLLAFAITDIRSRFGSNSGEVILPLDIGDFFPGIKLTIPKQGDKKKLLDLSRRNALSYRIEKMKKTSARKASASAERILLTLQSDLRLKEKPVHIECFDNSNIQGSEPVAACVVFKNALPVKKEYRHYNIKEVKGIDDFASMEEVVFRRYRRLLEEKQSLPQLVVIDGGKGQLNSALKSLDKLELRGKIAIIGIAKKLEEIYFPDDPVPLYIDKNSESLKLIQNLRNEAHRFGITFHRLKRSGTMTRSVLEDIPGLGPKSIERLFSRFKSVEGIKNASLELLAEELGQSRALKVREHLQLNKL